jgi:hypothetical protein
MGDAAKAVPTTAAPLMKVLLEIFFMVDPFSQWLGMSPWVELELSGDYHNVL